MGRVKLLVDFDEVEVYLDAGCNGVQVAAAVGVSYDTLERRFREERDKELKKNKRRKPENQTCRFPETFAQYIKLRRAKGDAVLKDKMYSIATTDDRASTERIFLAKARLGMSERGTPPQNELPQAENADSLEATIQRILNEK